MIEILIEFVIEIVINEAQETFENQPIRID